jgi:hypothetical protein
LDASPLTPSRILKETLINLTGLVEWTGLRSKVKT